jgi:hypothetical protein
MTPRGSSVFIIHSSLLPPRLNLSSPSTLLQDNTIYEKFKRRIEIMKQNSLYHVTLPPKLEFQMRRAGSTCLHPCPCPPPDALKLSRWRR